MLYRYDSLTKDSGENLGEGVCSNLEDILNQIDRDIKFENGTLRFGIIIYMDDLTDEEESTIEKFIKWFKDNNYTQFDISIRSMKIEEVFGMWFTVTGKNHNNERVSFAPLQSEGFFITFPIEEKENFIKLSRKILAENN